MGKSKKNSYPQSDDKYFDSVDIGYDEGDDYPDSEDCIYISRESLKDFMASITINPGLIADILHVTHVLLSALDLLSRCHDVSVYHLQRKIKMLSISSSIDDLTEDDIKRIAEDDERERLMNNGQIVYLHSLNEDGSKIMCTLDYLINVQLDELYEKHPELDKNIMYQIYQQAIAIFSAVAKAFGYSVQINPNKLC